MSQTQSLAKIKDLLFKKYENLSKHRLDHILGVSEMAVLLANRYGVDPVKAEIAALMHDYSKYDDPNDYSYLLSSDEIEECNKYPFLYHAYLSAYNYKILTDDFDLDIFNAIYNHVFGRPNMSKLEEIIMIADYTEKNRTYKSCIEVREILLNGDLYKAIVESLKYTISFEQSKGNKPHPRQVEVLKEYEGKIK